MLQHNYFVKNLIVFTINENKQESEDKIKQESETLDGCDLQLNKLDELSCNSKEELDSKKEYLMNLNNKLLDIKKMLQDIKDQLNNK